MKSKFLCLVLVFVMALLFVGCTPTVTPTLTLEEQEVNIYVGKEYTVKPILENATNSAITLTAENPAIAKVEGKKVIGQVAGTTNVTVALVSHPDIKATLKVNVLEQPSITINGEKMVELHEGQTYQIPVITSGVSEITWTSSDPAVASVDANGLVTALKAGGVTRIKAQYGEYSDHVDISVSKAPEVRIEGPSTVNVGDTIELDGDTYKIDEDIVWSSSNEEIAKITNKGVVKGIAPGEVTITATAGDYSKSVVITVLPAPAIEITGEKSMYKGYTTELAITWINLEETAVTWSSADTAVATVDAEGKVTAIEAGIAKITARAGEYVAEFQISIQLEPTVTISGENSVCVTEQVKLELTIENMEIPDGITWESSNPAVATVDNGVVTGLTEGTVTITVVVGEKTATYEVTVRAMDDKVTYHFDGGVSAELYNSTKAVADFTLTSYNSNSGGFWGGGYSSNIYITDQSGDPKATFSDRIYIGKNQYTGYYEVKQILLSGGSQWHEEAEYVISISSSYSNYRTIHAQVQKISLGDIIILPDDITGIKKDNTCPAKFYNPKLSVDTLDVLKNDFDGTLVVPQKLGFDFLGWYDKDGNKVETVSEVSGKVELFAKWDEKNPVTDITVNNIPAEMVTGETFAIEAAVTPTDAFFQEVLISTSNKDLIALEGTTITAKSAGTATITITDYVGKIVKTYEIVVNSIPSIDLSFDEEYVGVLKPGEKLQLNPVYVGKALEGLSFEYKSSDAAIATVDAAGEITAVANGEAEITIKATAGDKSYELVVGVTVNGLTEADKIDEVINLLANTNFAEVEVGNMCLYNDGTNRYYDSSYGSVNKFLFEPLVYDTTYNTIADNNNSNHGVERSKSEIYFVTVHDTATLTGTPEAIANNMATGSSVSIHYSVSNGIVWRVLSEKYVAWHAGDGTGVQFEWLPTGVKGEEGVQPEFDMVQEGNKYYFTVNGTKTNIEVPISNGSKTIKNPSKAHFSRLGPTWMVKNGQIYMGKPWASFGQVAAGVISSRGGNNNSVGIEMSVNTSGDIYDTYQRTAKLVADILIRNNLDLTRVKQHNTFDGKNCPQGLIAGNYWDQFMSMVEINYILMKDYKDVKIEFKSNNPDIVGDNGRVINPPAVTTTVSYEVTVTVGSSSKTIKLYSVVPGSTTWEQWDGSYSSSIIWNNGNYSL